MSIAVGASATSGAGGGNQTTATCVTQATGSNFEIIVFTISAGGTIGVQDNKSNSYSLINTYGTLGSLTISRFLCENGAGGTGHTGSMTGVTGGANGVVLVEMTGAAFTGQPVASATGTNGSSTSPISCGTLSGLTPPSTGYLIVTAASVNDATAETFADATGGFTILQTHEAGGGNLQFVVGYKVVTSAGSYPSTWSFTSGDNTACIGAMEAFSGVSPSSASIAWII